MSSFTERLNDATSMHEQMAIIEEAKHLAKQYAIQNPQSIAIKQVASAEGLYKTKATLGSPNTETAYNNYLRALLEFADSLNPPTEE